MKMLSEFQGAAFGNKTLRGKMTSPLRPARASEFAKGWRGHGPRYCGTAQIHWTDPSGGKLVQDFRVGVVRVNGQEKLFLDGGRGKIGTDTDLELFWEHVERFRVPIRFANTLKRRKSTLDATVRLLKAWGFTPERSKRGKRGAYALRFPEESAFKPILAVALAKRLGKERTKQRALAGGSRLPDDIEKLAGDPGIAAFEEGFRKGYKAHRYERDPRLVQAAREEHGWRCMVCQFDFGEVYGERGAGFVEVHHLKPVSGGPRVNGIKDVVVLCANCHRMLHRGDSVMKWRKLEEQLASHPEVKARLERRKHELPPIISKRSPSLPLRLVKRPTR